MNSIVGRTLHLRPHEHNHGEDTPPTTTWTQSWGEYSTYHHMNSIMGVTPPTTTWTQSWGVHSTYNNINSIMGRTLHLPPHELNHGEHTPPTTTWTQSWGGHSNDFFDLEAGFCFLHCFSSWPLGSSSDFKLYLAYDVVRWVPKQQVEPSFSNLNSSVMDEKGS